MPSEGPKSSESEKIITTQHARVIGDRTARCGCGDEAMSWREERKKRDGRGDTASTHRKQEEDQQHNRAQHFRNITPFPKKACTQG